MLIMLMVKLFVVWVWLKKIFYDVVFVLICLVDGGLFGVFWVIDWRLNFKLLRFCKLNYWFRIVIVFRERNRREEKKNLFWNIWVRIILNVYESL